MEQKPETLLWHRIVLVITITLDPWNPSQKSLCKVIPRNIRFRAVNLVYTFTPFPLDCHNFRTLPGLLIRAKVPFLSYYVFRCDLKFSLEISFLMNYLLCIPIYLIIYSNISLQIASIILRKWFVSRTIALSQSSRS